MALPFLKPTGSKIFFGGNTYPIEELESEEFDAYVLKGRQIELYLAVNFFEIVEVQGSAEFLALLKNRLQCFQGFVVEPIRFSPYVMMDFGIDDDDILVYIIATITVAGSGQNARCDSVTASVGFSERGKISGVRIPVGLMEFRNRFRYLKELPDSLPPGMELGYDPAFLDGVEAFTEALAGRNGIAFPWVYPASPRSVSIEWEVNGWDIWLVVDCETTQLVLQALHPVEPGESFSGTLGDATTTHRLDAFLSSISIPKG